MIALALILAIPVSASAKKKKDQRGLLESMQSVPCGAKQRGLTGLGSAVASLGVDHVNSHEVLCPQYLLRTDQMDYHIRPLKGDKAAILPVGQEAEFKIKKDRLLLRVADSKDHKEYAYQVVSMQPPPPAIENSSRRELETPGDPGHVNNYSADRTGIPQTIDHSPPQP
jgi:hypothetical protein